MYVVAITALGSVPIDARLPELAAALGTTAYELRLAINGGLPAVVLLTPDVSRAELSARALTKHGVAVVSLDRRQLVPSSAMTPLRDFRLETDGVAPDGTSAERLGYAELRALVRAVHRSVMETTNQVKGKQLDPVRAIATGGLLMRKSTTKEVTTRSEARQQVLYLFPATGTPWILREHDARYQGLGAALRPTSLENFVTTIARLRQLSPLAAYDERLMTPRPVRGLGEGPDATDLLAHLVAAAVTGSA